MIAGFPHTRVPTGWYQIGWSFEFPVGEARPLRYFGADLVAYRGHSGNVVVLNAHCLHMGAHLGHGGVVVDDEIECPFHGWRWDAEGRNTHIPDGSPPKRGQHTMRCWSVAENCGVVLMWYDADGGKPTWEVPQLIEDPDRYYPIDRASRYWSVRVHPQMVSENAIDSAHFTYVHRAGSNPVILDIDDRGPILHVSQEMEFGSRKKSTWLTPDGPVKGSLEIDLFGLGLSHTRFAGADEAYTLVGVTPIDGETSAYRMTNWALRNTDGDEPDELARRRIEEQFRQAERDFVIWENMIYIDKPPLMRSETRAYRAFHTWAERFYTGSGADARAADVRAGKR
ncbi:Rieske 2Fe-2S domain-containing protein [Mycolicibacterium thermoresistibile]|uniref:cholesterol 7-desaturase n=2 Tax=Mycolicibacterium thermoresistibile TaxID=1797 RepID=G7CH25_MYCT3|nr:Rieske 2Fe-2S domain-containing protein [Mycolicibacterium thermoresistibile]EHI12135.1 Rieske (2Fe-2S) domain-containing protein [Mycolicibacterium thermoresistibile ATCC 19527]MCV7191150.1 Rieske (2Fe-2S) protein [Mycolicibacterium thermoresistibile]GAT15502.1 Rieske (2Fe-2S) domain-containing protein [Mycolicibacterium thermoresistibile]SNW16947.1 rieske (2Fe-2S) domain-containing protein [Mycolicibacterium thermoresistibile]